jgi:biopolymer transport protein ExbD
MSMNVSQSGTDEAMCDVNTTPLIDVMLVLLVMLIVTLPPQTHAVKLDLPPPQPPKNIVQPPRINIDIDPDGTIVVNGSPMSGIPALDAFFQQQALLDPQPQIHLQPSALAKYDVIANVMASAQRNKMTRMGFTNVGQFAD